MTRRLVAPAVLAVMLAASLFVTPDERPLTDADQIRTVTYRIAARFQELFGVSPGDGRAIWVRETLPVGWGDTYFQFVPGQSFDITRLPNGTYFVEVTANPTGELHERNADNNTRLRRVILRGRRGARMVRVPAWHGIDTEGGGGGLFSLARL